MGKTKWTIDKAHTDIQFKAKHLMITNVKGGFRNFDAVVESDRDNFLDADVLFTADVASVFTGNEQRDEHLKSADFFDSEKFPQIKFKSLKYEKNGSDSTYNLIGDLTIKDVTKPVVLNVEFGGVVKDPWGNTKAGLQFSGKINRKDFGLNFHVVNEAGNLLVSDEIKLVGDIQLSAN